MSFKFLKTLFLFFFIVACNNNAQQTTESAEEEKKDTSILTEADIAKFNYIEFELDKKAEALAEPWESFTRLRSIVSNFKKADFSFFDTDKKATNQIISELRKTIPDTLKTQSVLSRITIVENMLYKLDETYELSTTTKNELAASLKELLIAYSNLNFQLNKKLEKDAQPFERP